MSNEHERFRPLALKELLTLTYQPSYPQQLALPCALLTELKTFTNVLTNLVSRKLGTPVEFTL
jgi:hypothetical protein